VSAQAEWGGTDTVDVTAEETRAQKSYKREGGKGAQKTQDGQETRRGNKDAKGLTGP